VRKLIARVFTYSLDGVADAEEGTQHMEFCRGLWDADESQLDPMAELYQRALIMGRVAYEGMRMAFAPGGTSTDHPWAGIFNAAPKVVFSRTLKSVGWSQHHNRR
jgi:dihydrofolate reductase